MQSQQQTPLDIHYCTAGGGQLTAFHKNMETVLRATLPGSYKRSTNIIIPATDSAIWRLPKSYMNTRKQPLCASCLESHEYISAANAQVYNVAFSAAFRRRCYLPFCSVIIFYLLALFTEAATVSRIYPGDYLWTLYHSGSSYNNAIAGCIPEAREPGCTDNNAPTGKTCRWNAYRTQDMGYGVYGVMRFRLINANGNDNFMNGGPEVAFWVDPLVGVKAHRIDFGNKNFGEVEFEFVDKNCQTLPPIWNATNSH